MGNTIVSQITEILTRDGMEEVTIENNAFYFEYKDKNWN
jgi:hypothetical protein